MALEVTIGGKAHPPRDAGLDANSQAALERELFDDDIAASGAAAADAPPVRLAQAEIPMPPPAAPNDNIEGSYGQTRQVTDDQDRLAAARERAASRQAPPAPAADEPLPEPTPLEQDEDGGFRDVAGSVLGDMARGVVELPLQVTGGVRDAAQETIEAVDSLTNWLNTHVADLTLVEFDDPLAFPEVPQAQSITGGVTRGLTQFIAGFVGAGKVTGLSKLKNLGKMANIGRAGVQGAIADAIARDPKEENLANLLREIPALQNNAVLEFLAADPEDSEAEARLKKAFEGLGVGFLIDGLILGLGAVKATRAFRSASDSTRTAARDVAEGARDATEAAGQRAEQRIEERAATRGTTLNSGVDPRELTDPLVALVGRAVSRGTDEAAPTFFSNAGRAVSDAKIEKGTADQWLALPGLKKEEIEFTGLDEFLRGQDGSVTKQQVLDHLQANGVGLEETVKSSPTFEFSSAEDFQSAIETAEQAGDFARAERLTREHEAFEGFSPGSDVGDTKFATYTLPGGENYRETLIRLPLAEPNLSKAQKEAIEILRGRDDPQAPAQIAMIEQRGRESGGEFTGGHYDEPNVLVHTRSNERTTADGGRTLFIEELQSDWLQQHRSATVAIKDNVTKDFDGIVKRMEEAGAVKVDCD